ncbi:hypothetical protein, partial [Bacillus mycoides]|uniref:hypothetical protein n=1 Tax=Bacillus mycoides TaxID=1405 RepID=UPI003A8017E3
IQHTKGVFAIHSVLAGCADFFDDTLPLSQALWSVESKFRTILEKSEVAESDWLVDGSFSNFKDEEGYQKIADMLEINRLVHKQRANVGNEDVNGWKETSMGEHESCHIYVTYLGDKTPEYKVISNPDGEGWVLAEFNTFTGEYTAFDDDVVFDTIVEAKNYVDALGK